jgi:hypothetical protein
MIIYVYITKKIKIKNPPTSDAINQQNFHESLLFEKSAAVAKPWNKHILLLKTKNKTRPLNRQLKQDVKRPTATGFVQFIFSLNDSLH